MRAIRKEYKDGFFVDLIDYYKTLSGWYKHSEIETQDWIIDNIKEDWVTFDCGAHIGYYSMLLSYHAPKGKVYAFEPGDKSCRMFANNIQYNTQKFNRDFRNIELVKTALGNQVNKGVEEVIYMAGSGRPNNGRTQGKFDFTTLDHFCESQEIDRVDFIKIDVDSWDYEVLLGAERLIRKFKPIIISEVNYALGWRGYSERDVERLLNKWDYLYEVLDFPSPINWLMYPRWTLDR